MAGKSRIFIDRAPTPWHLWVVGILSLLWNAVGAFDFVATQLQLESYMAQFTAVQLDFFYGFPIWVHTFWALAVWSAVAGSLALLFRSRFAVSLFVVSVISMIVTSIHNFGMANGAEIMGQASVILSVVIAVISVLLVVYSQAMLRRRVLV
ncbi:MAG: hypothetical protein AAGJ52_09030 [Pseudomonadota bacterium]